jgi:hypothetical protein
MQGVRTRIILLPVGIAMPASVMACPWGLGGFWIAESQAPLYSGAQDPICALQKESEPPPSLSRHQILKTSTLIYPYLLLSTFCPPCLLYPVSASIQHPRDSQSLPMFCFLEPPITHHSSLITHHSSLITSASILQHVGAPTLIPPPG